MGLIAHSMGFGVQPNPWGLVQLQSIGPGAQLFLLWSELQFFYSRVMILSLSLFSLVVVPGQGFMGNGLSLPLIGRGVLGV